MLDAEAESTGLRRATPPHLPNLNPARRANGMQTIVPAAWEVGDEFRPGDTPQENKVSDDCVVL